MQSYMCTDIYRVVQRMAELMKLAGQKVLQGVKVFAAKCCILLYGAKARSIVVSAACWPAGWPPPQSSSPNAGQCFHRPPARIVPLHCSAPQSGVENGMVAADEHLYIAKQSEG